MMHCLFWLRFYLFLMAKNSGMIQKSILWLIFTHNIYKNTLKIMINLFIILKNLKKHYRNQTLLEIKNKLELSSDYLWTFKI
jgi:hypothetical protein